MGAEHDGAATAGVHRTGSDAWSVCRFQPIDDPAVAAALLRVPAEGLAASPEGWWLVLCQDDRLGAGLGSDVIHLWGRGAALPPAVRDRLVEAAIDALAVPYLTPRSSPAGTPDQPLVTGLDTWLWVDAGTWAPVEAQAAIPVASVTATATPSALTWEAGDGTDPAACTGPGRPWDPATPTAAAPCGHRYERTSGDAPGGAWPLGVTVRWDVTWTCTPACGTGTAAPFVLTVTRPVVVQQVQTRLTR